MRYLKIVVCVLMLMALVIPPSVGAQKSEQEPPNAEEISLEQFLKELITAVQADDAERIRQLVRDNPNAAKGVYRQLTLLGEGTGEAAKLARFFATKLGGFLSDNIPEITEELSLQQLVEEFVEALQAYDIEHLRQLIASNPNTAEQVQQWLTVLVQDPGEEVKRFRFILEALEMFRAGDFSLVLDSLREEGAQAYYTSDYPAALGKWQEGLNQALTIDDKDYIGQFLNNIGAVYRCIGQYQQALDYYKQALIIAREIHDKKTEVAALGNTGIIYNKLSQHNQALNYHEQALTIARDIDDKQEESRQLDNIGIAYSNLGQYQEALKYHQQALLIVRAIGDKSQEGEIMSNLGVVYRELGKYQQALEHQQQSLAISRSLNNKSGEAAALSDIGLVYHDLGQYQKALEYFRNALGILRGIGNKDLESSCLGNLGITYRKLGQYQQALEYHQQALTIDRKVGDKRGEGADLTNIGNVYADLGQYQHAVDHYAQALNIKLEIEDQGGAAYALGNSANALLHLGQIEEAIKSSELALTIGCNIGNKNIEMNSLMIAGKLHQLFGKLQQALKNSEQNLEYFTQALDYYQQALIITREIGNKGGEGTALTCIGSIHEDLGQYQEAYIEFKESITINEALGITGSLWFSQRGLATVEVRLNQPESAITHYEQALDNIETLRAGLTEQEHKLSFMQDSLHVYDELIDLLQDLHQTHPDKGYDRKALEIFERKQGRVFLEEMGQSGARLFAGLPEAIMQKELDLELQLEQTRKQLVNERSKLITEQNKELIQNLEEREKTLVAEQNALQEQIKTEYPDYHALKYPKPVSFAELQEKVLQPGELMLVYGVMKEKTMLWLISPSPTPSHQGRGTKPSLPGGKYTPLSPSRGEDPPQPHPGGDLRMYTLDVGEEELREKVAELRRIMELEWKRSRGEIISLEEGKHSQEAQRKVVRYGTPKDQGETKTFAQASHELYRLLIPEEVRPLLTEEHTLNIVPTGPLYALPFEALVTALPGDSVHYLIEDIPMSYLSSASLLKTLRESQARRKATAPYPLLAFAHPVYKPTPNPSQEGNRGTSIQTLRSQSYRDFFRGEFAELPETAEEARAIKTLLNAQDNSDPLQLREKASRENVFAFNINERLDDYQYLVFATHGILPGEVDRITQPALVLSFPENNGYLTMADVFQLQLNAKLVSLSACNTGSGEQVRGEGVMGLTRAFMYAGTPAIAVTLWSVETFSAKELDVGMFEHLNAGQPPADALRAIKLQMLRGNKGKDYTHPYYWAPFVVFGDGR